MYWHCFKTSTAVCKSFKWLIKTVLKLCTRVKLGWELDASSTYVIVFTSETEKSPVHISSVLSTILLYWKIFNNNNNNCGSSLVEAFNAIQGLSHTHSSSPHSLVTRVQSQSVKHSHSGVTASCSVQCRRYCKLDCELFSRIYKTHTHNMDDILIKNNLQVM